MSRDNQLLNDQINSVYNEITVIIDDTKDAVVQSVNSSLSLTYWHVGRVIAKQSLNADNEKLTNELVLALGKKLTQRYGKGFSRANLFNCIKFYSVYSEQKSVYTLCGLVSWSHIRLLIYMEDSAERVYYLEMCCYERWSVRTLKQRIDSMTYRRTVLAKQPDNVIEDVLGKLSNEKVMSPSMVLRDPYVLDFLELPPNYCESDLENVILIELSNFIHEFGCDFCFVARQKRISIHRKDYYIDLLFYHRGLKRLIVIELKLGSFKPSHKGQMELYLKWLSKHEYRDGENQPLGIILCAEKNEEEVELLELQHSGIHVAEYFMELPPKRIFEEKLHQAISLAREKIVAQKCQLEDKINS